MRQIRHHSLKDTRRQTLTGEAATGSPAPGSTAGPASLPPPRGKGGRRLTAPIWG